MARFFVERPIVAIVISIIMVLLGVVAMSGLPIAQYPEIVPPMVQVTTTFIGASATDVEASVATPLEQQINGVEKMIYMKSTNANDGTLTLKVSFEVGSNLDMDNVLTQNRVSQAQPQMPQSVKNYGVSVKKALAFPLLVISIKSPNGTYDSSFLSNYTTININDAIARIQGVGQINLFGGSDYAMRVWLRPDVIGRLGLTIPDIANAISAQNQLTPAGQIGGPPAATGTEYTYTVRTKGRLLNEEEFGNIIVRTDAARLEVRLKDVARIELGTMLYNAVGRHDGKPSAVIAVFQIPGTNALDVADRIKATMEDLEAALPARHGIRRVARYDAAGRRRHQGNRAHAVRGGRPRHHRRVRVPAELARDAHSADDRAGLAGRRVHVLPAAGLLDQRLSLLGLVLAIGIVVDDAIVVVEAVMHHIEHGMEPKEATIKAMEEVSGPVIAIGLILSAVFVPVGFMGGITGRLYQQFAITIALSVLLSVINALTLSPALAAMLLKAPTGKKTLLTPFYNGFNKVFGWFDGSLRQLRGHPGPKDVPQPRVHRRADRRRPSCSVQRIPGGFVPEEDQGYILVNALLPDAASLERTDAVMKKAEAVLEKNEAVEGFNTITGYSLLTGAYSSNMGFFFVQLKPWEERHTAEAHANGVRRRARTRRSRRDSGSGRHRLRSAVHSRASAPAPASRWSCRIAAADRRSIWREQTQRFMEAARKRPEIGRINSLYRASVPQIYADIDRSKVLQVGRAAERRQHDARRAARQLLRERLQPVRPRLQGVRAGGAGVPPGSEAARAVLRARTRRAAWCRSTRCCTTGPSDGPEFTNRFNLFRIGGAHRRAGGGLSRRRRRSMRSSRPRAKCCRRT